MEQILNGGIQYVPQIEEQYTSPEFNASLTGYDMPDTAIDRVISAGTEYYSTIQNSKVCVSTGGTLIYATVVDDGEICICSGGTANYTAVNSDGELDIESGGTANYTAVNSEGELDIEFGGTANSTTINYDGEMAVKSGGYANNIFVKRGELLVASGGTATNIAWTPCEGFLDIQTGAFVTFTSRYSGVYLGEDEQLRSTAQTMNNKVVTGGDMFVMNGGKADNTVFSDGWLEVWYGGSANNTTVNFYGDFMISSGGIAYNTTLNYEGWMDILYGGSAANTTLADGGNLTISSGGVHRGTLQIAARGNVNAYYGARIDFTVADRSAADGYLINDLSRISGSPDYTITVSENQAQGTYKLAQGCYSFHNSISIGTDGRNYGTVSANGAPLLYNNTAYSLTLSNGELALSITSATVPEPVLYGDENGISFTDLSGDTHIVEISRDNFSTVIVFEVERNAVDIHNLPSGNYQWQVDNIRGNDISGTANTSAPQKFTADGDLNPDIFFASPDGVWSKGYAAEYQGDAMLAIAEPQVMLQGKNRITDCFDGMGDDNILLLTDDANGDAVFTDDLFSARPAETNQYQSRLNYIREIRAGAGDDVIDLTSRQIYCDGWEMTIRGGDGDDVIWASGGDNDLFGDAGNDRIIGSSGFDVIAGGTGDDCMQSGGGNDIFCFGNNWGNDTVIINTPATTCTLWFASGSASNWDAAAGIYRDGSNSVTVQGAGNVQLYFGDDTRAWPGQYADLTECGAFNENSSEKIFEDKTKGMIA